MKFTEHIERFQHLDHLVKTKNTGTPNELADRLKISRSHLYNMINYLRDIGMEAKYSRKFNSFYYENNNKSMEINFSIKLISNNKSKKIYGSGHNNKSFNLI